jgi:hypothetical protein
VVTVTSQKNLEEFQVLKSKWKGIRERLVRRLLESKTRSSGATMQRYGEDNKGRLEVERREGRWERCT